jgi:5-hydroxyisourate hydrolase-like protein (transthyretin family)
VYPNPVNSDKKINIIFDVNKVNQSNNNVEIYNLNGQRVLKTKIINTQGFYNKEINLNSLEPGVYMLKFTSGNYQKMKKIVLR